MCVCVCVFTCVCTYVCVCVCVGGGWLVDLAGEGMGQVEESLPRTHSPYGVGAL